MLIKSRLTGILMDLPTPTLLLPTTTPFTCPTLARPLVLITSSFPLVTFSLPRRVPSTISGLHPSRLVPTTPLPKLSVIAVSTAPVTTTAGLSTVLRMVLMIGATMLLHLSGVTGQVFALTSTLTRRLSRCTAAQDRQVSHVRTASYLCNLTYSR